MGGWRAVNQWNKKCVKEQRRPENKSGPLLTSFPSMALPGTAGVCLPTGSDFHLSQCFQNITGQGKGKAWVEQCCVSPAPQHSGKGTKTSGNVEGVFLPPMALLVTDPVVLHFHAV